MNKKQIIANFIQEKSLVDKFETLLEYIPQRFQEGYIPGLKEEVEEFIEELKDVSES